MKKLFTLTALFISIGAMATEDHHNVPPAKANKSFDQLKQLVGTWKGTTTTEGKEETMTVTYELTSGGNVIMERLSPGTPHEMVSIYHPDGKGVAMTHYCLMGNQPRLSLKTSDDKSMTFEMRGTTGITSAKEMHMHGLNIKWTSPTEITQEWTSFDKGKKADTKTFNFKKI